jgi:hypothetical protein
MRMHLMVYLVLFKFVNCNLIYSYTKLPAYNEQIKLPILLKALLWLLQINITGGDEFVLTEIDSITF